MMSRPQSSVQPPKISITPLASTTASPIPTRTTTTLISDVPTTIITQSFADRIWITVTQLQKFGCLYQATTSANPSLLDNAPSSSSLLPPPLPTTSITKLVGTEPSPAHTALYQLYVAQIAAIVRSAVGSEDGRPVVVSLALKENATGREAGEKAGGQDEQEDEMLMTSQEERTRYMGVMEAVIKCRVW